MKKIVIFLEKIKNKFFINNLKIFLFALVCLSFFTFSPFLFSKSKSAHFTSASSPAQEKEIDKKVDVIAWEHWLDLFLHEAGHMVLVNAFYQARAKGDFKVFEPRGFRARLGVKKTLQTQKNGKKVYKLDFSHDGAAYYVITSQKKTTAKKFIRGFHRQYLINLAGNTITKFFLANKPKVIAHLASEKLVIGTDDIKKANNVDQTVKNHLSSDLLKELKWGEKISPANVKKATLKILFEPKNWKIFQVLVKALIIKKVLLDKKTVITWNFSANDKTVLLQNGKLPLALKTKIPQKGEAGYQIWTKFEEWAKLIENKYINKSVSPKPIKPKLVKKKFQSPKKIHSRPFFKTAAYTFGPKIRNNPRFNSWVRSDGDKFVDRVLP